MRFIYLIIFTLVLASCVSSHKVSSNKKQEPRYGTYYYKNQVVKVNKTQLTELKLETPRVALNSREPATLVDAGMSVGSIDTRTTRGIHKDDLPSKLALVDKEEVDPDDYIKATQAGGTGLLLGIIGLILALVALFAGLEIVLVLAVIALFAGFIFSLIGLKGGNRREAITGLIVSGIPLILGILGLVTYAIQN